ncbi:uncharacterized protein N7483_007784 [Penicillium malachiteum]|uniref:uncharacterized protein n=1 Tax=Penicillium malachiteum TaxID=1324776 RepID=UPI002548FC24|nr:uncharacterized protein N7483_007784 [Penicillium malachiteum]KAJ5726427.1 hypothetical protein N7483_007784 [Penicillium malachiteum]
MHQTKDLFEWTRRHQRELDRLKAFKRSRSKNRVDNIATAAQHSGPEVSGEGLNAPFDQHVSWLLLCVLGQLEIYGLLKPGFQSLEVRLAEYTKSDGESEARNL